MKRVALVAGVTPARFACGCGDCNGGGGSAVSHPSITVGGQPTAHYFFRDIAERAMGLVQRPGVSE